ncbi:hypothetical protein INT46_009554 [Mucor plumbeus]|uniref:Eukaryotic translation initiation factor 4E n=1 Tax=Mucor plumbeus TaxID=97098 RepID=A0A8H7R749_9FUNG|nr:hypothetical protein INT46_009554 [Mucor plumbeus]
MSVYQHSTKISFDDKLGIKSLASTEQFTSEQSIFHQHRNQNKLLIHIPALSTKNHHYPNLFLSSPTKKPLKINKTLLETTSKTPLNVGLDNILFVSTLENYWTRTTTFSMKRHTSSGGAQNVDNSTNTITTRRYSHPEADQAQHHHIMLEYPCITCSSSSSSSNKTQTGHDFRRLSIQSDAASTELIRRFSSESTTSSLSSISSLILESHNKLHQQQKQHKVQEASSDAQTSHPVVVESTMKLIQVAVEKEQLDRDPGHACETMHSLSEKMQQLQGTGIKEEEEKDRLPIWADPIKVNENPTRFQYTKSYLKQRGMLNDSSLPLANSCVFYFSDNNTFSNKSEQYISTVKSIFECGTVWSFSARWRTFKEKHNKNPSQLSPNQNIFCFIKGIEPMWEDPVNKDGGRLIITVYNTKLLDSLFEWILCAFIGGGLLEDGVVGIAVSKRYRGDRIELWLDQNADDKKIPALK